MLTTTVRRPFAGIAARCARLLPVAEAQAVSTDRSLHEQRLEWLESDLRVCRFALRNLRTYIKPTDDPLKALSLIDQYERKQAEAVYLARKVKALKAALSR